MLLMIISTLRPIGFFQSVPIRTFAPLLWMEHVRLGNVVGTNILCKSRTFGESSESATKLSITAAILKRKRSHLSVRMEASARMKEVVVNHLSPLIIRVSSIGTSSARRLRTGPHWRMSSILMGVSVYNRSVCEYTRWRMSSWFLNQIMCQVCRCNSQSTLSYRERHLCRRQPDRRTSDERYHARQLSRTRVLLWRCYYDLWTHEEYWQSMSDRRGVQNGRLIWRGIGYNSLCVLRTAELQCKRTVH